jgi:hypothetical protein
MFKDRRLVIAGGMGLALVTGILIATALIWSQPPDPEPSEPQSGLMVETGRLDDAKLDPAHPLRCFVDGKSIGELPLAECARRNGVAAGALDVGLDATGALAAAPSGAASQGALTPLPPSEDAAQPTEPRAAAKEEASQAVPESDICWRYGDGGWSRLPEPVALAACAQALFPGRCGPPGATAYGRWGKSTLRLIGGAVQIAPDGHSFHALTAEGPACSGDSAGR